VTSHKYKGFSTEPDLSPPKRLLISCLAVVALAITPHDSRAQAQTDKATNINLEGYGWLAPPHTSTREWSGTTRQLMSTDHKGNILVGYTVREREGLATRGTPSLSFHILRFAPDGKLNGSFSLPTSRWFDNSLFLDSQDHILTRANDALQILIGGDEHQSTNSDWKNVAGCAMRCRIIQSTSRRAVLLQDGYGEHALTFIDTSQWPPRVGEICGSISPYFQHSITDKFAYSATQDSRDDALLNRWPFCDYKSVARIPIATAGAVHALNDERIAIVHHDGVEVISSDGNRKFLWKMVKNDVPLNEVSASENGERFAVQIVTFRGGSALLDIGGRVVARRIAVYDSETGKQVSSVPVPKTYRYVFGFYLSPDGHQLAILQDGVLSIRNLE
jgi:hypothetical protein